MVCVADYSGGAAAAAVVARESAHRHTAVVGTSSAGFEDSKVGFTSTNRIPTGTCKGPTGIHTGKKTPGGAGTHTGHAYR